MRRPGSNVPLSLAGLADLSLAEGQREAAIELINQAYAIADAATEQRGAKRKPEPRAAAAPLRRVATAVA